MTNTINLRVDFALQRTLFVLRTETEILHALIRVLCKNVTIN